MSTRRDGGVRVGHLLVGLVLSALLPGPATAQTVTADRFGAIAARNIGPAGMSGRVTAVAVVDSEPDRIYVGSATGGLFRSADGGVSWQPVFDEQPVLGIGAVAVFQPNPDIVWVGTGEGNPRNSAGVGDGIFKSVDGGLTWERMGLAGSERIHRVITHPSDPDIVFVAVMGPAWSDSDARGVYRTTDGGESWELVLAGDNPSTGAADLVADPRNPDKLFAALWDFRRDPWFFRSGGPGSGLFVTMDGGDSWERLGTEQGLPDGELGRIGLAVAPGRPEVVYALVEAERSVLLRSSDGGRGFETVSDRRGIVPRPFYYADLRVDPDNENRIYSLRSTLQVSEDQGRTFRTVVPSGIIHGDVQELWIDPADGRHMIIGNDGGMGITWDQGENWRFVENLALSQFYRISLDDRIPYQVYGGLQDNGSWYGPSDVWETKGILNAHWRRVGGGDGFTVLDDPSDARYGYAMSQAGALQRFDRVTGQRVSIQPVHPEGERLRFSWNAGLALDPHDGITIYLGSQYVHRSSDQGASWEIISPDLTTDDPAKQRQDYSGGLTLDATGAENHTTIFDISPSPLEAGVLWVGTDDGNVQLTRDGGATWTEVGARIEGAPATGWVSDIEPSNHDPGAAYVTFDEHRRGDWTTYLFRTTDYGESWERLEVAGVTGFAHSVEEDPLQPNLLFLGTEFGLYVSLDRGRSWQRWTGLPAVPVRDMEIQPRDGDLVLGTHGRGIWILDDIRPLRAIAGDPAIATGAAHLFAPPPTYLHAVAEGIGYRSTGMAMWQGATRPYGALLSYWAGEDTGGPATLTVTAASGRPVAELTGPATPGLNRIIWNLRATADEDGTGVPSGIEVAPGRYLVTLDLGDQTSTAELDVLSDPRVADAVTGEQRRARWTAIAHASSLSETSQQADRAVSQALERVEAVLGTLPGDASALRTQGAALRDTLTAVRERVFSGSDCQGICGGETLSDPIRPPLGRLRGGSGAVTPLEVMMLEQASAALDRVLVEVNAVLTGPLASFRDALLEAGHTGIPEPEPVRREGG